MYSPWLVGTQHLRSGQKAIPCGFKQLISSAKQAVTGCAPSPLARGSCSTQTHLLLKTSCSQAVAFTSGGFSIAGTAGCMPNTLDGGMERKSLLISYQLPAQAYHNHFAWIFKPIINL